MLVPVPSLFKPVLLLTWVLDGIKSSLKPSIVDLYHIVIIDYGIRMMSLITGKYYDLCYIYNYLHQKYCIYHISFFLFSV